jgi:hypothetical protein
MPCEGVEKTCQERYSREPWERNSKQVWIWRFWDFERFQTPFEPSSHGNDLENVPKKYAEALFEKVTA